jgi:hypothetical protein
MAQWSCRITLRPHQVAKLPYCSLQNGQNAHKHENKKPEHEPMNTAFSAPWNFSWALSLPICASRSRFALVVSALTGAFAIRGSFECSTGGELMVPYAIGLFSSSPSEGGTESASYESYRWSVSTYYLEILYEHFGEFTSGTILLAGLILMSRNL